jgi:hypothetical protein
MNRNTLHALKDIVPVRTSKAVAGVILQNMVRVIRRGKRSYYSVKYRNVKPFRNPTDEELVLIEENIIRSGVKVLDYTVCPDAFHQFQQSFHFPSDYHRDVIDEKLLEHYISFDLLGLRNYPEGDRYLDVAACGSPWAWLLRENRSIQAYAIDLNVPEDFLHMDYYLQMDATRTTFPDSSIKGMSLQCAFEMFLRDDDIYFIREANRILAKGGKIIIVPLYLHTHYCSYSTPDCWGKGFSDSDGEEYIRMDSWNIPSSRKYDPSRLRSRILRTVEELGMHHRIHVLRNKGNLGSNIYCHFILEVEK